MRTSTKRLAGGLAAAGGAGIATWALVRPRLERWGATDAEVAAKLPGDAHVPNAAIVTTNAVTIHARPADIWPWLAQLGWRRGGLYSYDWLDRLFGYLDRPSAEEVLPDFQQLHVGDTIPIGRGLSWPVLEVEPERALVLELLPGKVTWSFALVPVNGNATRLVTRSRCAPPETLRERLTLMAIEPPAFIMTRKMLLGIKRRAEALARRRAPGG
ncbi:MAG TPA: hypothetical protein VFS44_12510 [Gemmatimonadaceae bacterium]|nr:hypothetical protein [Gemmatimonadaceae bacterium]